MTAQKRLNGSHIMIAQESALLDLDKMVTASKCLMFEYPPEVRHALLEMKKPDSKLTFKLGPQVFYFLYASYIGIDFNCHYHLDLTNQH